MVDLDRFITIALATYTSHDDYLKNHGPLPIAGLASDPTPEKMLKVVLFELFIAMVLHKPASGDSDAFSIETAFRSVNSNKHASALEDFLASDGYKKYIKNVFLDDEGRQIFFSTGSSDLALLIRFFAIVRHIGGFKSEFQVALAEELADGLNLELSDDFDDVLSMCYEDFIQEKKEGFLTDGKPEEAVQALLVSLCYLFQMEETMVSLARFGDKKAITTASGVVQVTYETLAANFGLKAPWTRKEIIARTKSKIIDLFLDLKQPLENSKTITVINGNQEFVVNTADVFGLWSPVEREMWNDDVYLAGLVEAEDQKSSKKPAKGLTFEAGLQKSVSADKLGKLARESTQSFSKRMAEMDALATHFPPQYARPS